MGNLCPLELTTTFTLLSVAAWMSAKDVELYEIVNPSTNKHLLFQTCLSYIFKFLIVPSTKQTLNKCLENDWIQKNCPL